MTTAMLIDRVERDFREKVSNEVRLIAEGRGRYLVFTPFCFKDGDHLTILLKQNGTRWFLSDEAHTYMRISFDLDVQELLRGPRQKIIAKTLAEYGDRGSRRRTSAGTVRRTVRRRAQFVHPGPAYDYREREAGSDGISRSSLLFPPFSGVTGIWTTQTERHRPSTPGSQHIENFRGIKKLSIPRLGRVNLLAGRNGVGKSTVLDAIRVFAARGREQVLAQILNSREEVIELRDQEVTNSVEIDWTAIFHGRGVSDLLYISIGPKDKSDQLRIESTLFDLENTARDQLPATFSAVISGNRIQTLTADFQGHSFPWFLVA